MPRFLIAYLCTVVPFLAIDFVWLSQVALPLFRAEIPHLLAAESRMAAALAFYLLYVVGIVYFAVLPALRERSYWRALGNGLLFGLIAYATYDVTNYATLDGFPLILVLVDVPWGATLTGTSALLGYALASRFIKP